MTSTRIVTLTSLSVLLALGCGSEDATSPIPGTLFPWEWPARSQEVVIGYDIQTRDPSDLEGRVCQLYTQAAQTPVAGELGGVGVGEQSGRCRSFNSPPRDDFRAAPWEPLCAGTLDVTLNEETTTYALCSDSNPAPQSVDCGGIGRANNPIQVVSYVDEDIPGDEVGAAEVMVSTGEVPTIMSPEPFGSGMAIWPEGDLRIGWGGVGGDAIEIRISPRLEDGPTIVCSADDTGEFTIPGEFLSEISQIAAILEVARVRSGEAEVDGTTVRVVHRISDAIWLSR